MLNLIQSPIHGRSSSSSSSDFAGITQPFHSLLHAHLDHSSSYGCLPASIKLNQVSNLSLLTSLQPTPSPSLSSSDLIPALSLGTATKQQRSDPPTGVEETPARYAAYAMRLKTLIIASSRYVAYTSDIGEAFRPLTRPEVVKAAYGISWAYLIGDVAYAGYKASKNQGPLPPFGESTNSSSFNLSSDTSEVKVPTALSSSSSSSSSSSLSQGQSDSIHVGLVMARRAIFQAIASMALPAFTIHSVVRYSAPLFAKSSSARIRAAGPTAAGLMFVPALPFLFDHPVEHVVDSAFDWIEATFLPRGAGATDRSKKEL